MVNIIIAGVGGQGSLLASKILGHLYISKGYDVKVNEVHGMSQRGGSVVTMVRAGTRVDSPLVAAGEADLLIALEQLEAFRSYHMLSKTGNLVASEQRILPMPVISGAAKYPDNIHESCQGLWVDALQLAIAAGNVKAANVVMLGASARFLEFSFEEWKAALHELIPQKLMGINEKAFNLGYEYKK